MRLFWWIQGLILDIPRALVHECAVDCGDKFISGVHGDLVLHKSMTAIFEVTGLCLTDYTRMTQICVN